MLLASLLTGIEGIHAQTASTGALTGTVTDSSGAVIPGAKVAAINESTGEIRSVSSQRNGSYQAPFLPAGSYRVEVEKDGFKMAARPGVAVNVTAATRLDLQLEVGSASESVVVSAEPGLLETESPALGGLTDTRSATGLPLASRNFTQIMNLFPGIESEVNDATALGRSGGYVSGVNNASVNGTTMLDNDFRMNGIGVNDLQTSGSFSGGVPIPNPDSIQEFKVQTGLYDASYGRNAGAHVDVVTRSGSNDLHGNLFEFFRNETLNANAFFRNLNQQPRGVLRQNQFGGTLGGPIEKDKLFYFLSYQGTRQRNGVSGGGASNYNSPPLTNDRSRAGLGKLFAGRCGMLDGQCADPIAADGSNISAPAFNLLNLKLPNGQFLLPAPQAVNPGAPFDVQGFSTLSVPASYGEDQGLAGIDFIQSAKSSFKLSYFHSAEDTILALPGPSFGGAPVEGFPLLVTTTFQNFSLAHTYSFTPALVNHAILGLRRIDPRTVQQTPFHYSGIGVTAPPDADPYPQIYIGGAYTLGGNGQGARVVQNTYSFADSAFFVHGRHNLRFGGEIERAQINSTGHYLGALVFLSFEDFLLGQSGARNGTGVFSNVYMSSDVASLSGRAWRTWDGSLYLQDDIRATATLTLNLGLRYERLGGIGDELGRNATFDPQRANPDPPAGGTLEGYVVPSNFKGAIPAGVTRIGSNLGIRGDGQNGLGPRLGFAWQLPRTRRLVLRGGYGMYYSRNTGQAWVQLVFSPPFGVQRQLAGPANAGATFANPFPPAIKVPYFPAYSPSTEASLTTVAQGYRPPITQQYGMHLEAALARDLALEVGYVGSRGTRYSSTISMNQAGLASVTHPIRGQTANTVANIALRTPIQGFQASQLKVIQSTGGAWFNSLQASLRKRPGKGLQFQAAYTFSRQLATDGGNFSGAAAGSVTGGDQLGWHSRYGRSPFNRTHRLIVSALYDLPAPRASRPVLRHALGGWSISGISTFQSGSPLAFYGTNANNVFGISSDRAQLAPGCTHSQLMVSGPVKDRLNGYFNRACIAGLTATGGRAVWPILGDDGRGTGFGNSGVGIVTGPGQNNWDIGIVRRIGVHWPAEASRIEFRVELFNAFNHAQFWNPVTNVSSAAFGQILGTSVNPRIVQFALKFHY